MCKTVNLLMPIHIGKHTYIYIYIYIYIVRWNEVGEI